jgi:hypothetical protein
MFTICFDMPAAAPAPDPVEDTGSAWERALLDRQLADLGRLADMGMDIAADIHRRVTTADDSVSVAQLQHAAIDFSRVARAGDDAELDRETVERLVLEAGERLDRDQIWDDLKSLPFDDIVAMICTELGVATSPIAATMAGGGPRAEQSEEPVVEGAGGMRYAAASPLRDSS